LHGRSGCSFIARFAGGAKPPCFVVVYVVTGGKVRYTLTDGSTKDMELKSGEVLLRPPVTHADEALDDLEATVIELKK
jgi:nitrogen fixation protein FixH